MEALKGDANIQDTKAAWWRLLRWPFAAAAFCLIALFAFGSLFTTFMPWDDEGYFLLSYRDYLNGVTPYDSIYSFYGPYTFLAAGLFTAFDVSNVSHDGLRWITLAVWLGIAVLFSAAAFGRTADFIAAIVVLLSIGLRLNGLSRAVGHPQIWIIAALAVLLCLGTAWLTGPRHVRRAFWVGLIAGTILLFKINIGVYVLIACALLASLQLADVRWRNGSLGVTFLAASGLAAAMTLERVRGRDERWFVLVYICSLAAVLLTAWQRRPRPDPLRPAAVVWFSIGLATAVSFGIAAILATGTSVMGLWEGLVLGPLRLTRGYHWPFYDANNTASLGLCAAAAVLSAAVLAVTRSPRRVTAVAWLKLVAGTGVLLTSWYDPVAGLCASLLLLWLVVLDAPSKPVAYLDRTFLAVLSLLYSLELFPIAGDQIDWATLLPTVAAALMMADGTRALAEQRVVIRASFPVAAATVCILVAGVLGISAGTRAVQMWNRWQSLESVDLPGTIWLRLPPVETARLRLIATSMRKNCQTVLSLPGLYSFAIWSGVTPKERRRINSWPFLFGDDAIAKELRDSKSGDCVLVSEITYDLFRMLARFPSSDELLPSIPRTMTAIVSTEDTPIPNMPFEGKRIILYQATAPR